MKKSLLLGILIVSLTVSSVFAGGGNIKVFMNDSYIDFTDAKPIVKNDRTTVPVSIIAKNLGIDHTWDAVTKTVTFNQDNKTLDLKIGEQNSFIQDSRTYVPLRFIAENFGIEVDWRDKERTVVIGENAKNVVVELTDEEKSASELPKYVQDAVDSKKYSTVIQVQNGENLEALEIILSNFYKTSYLEAIEIIKKSVEAKEGFAGNFDNRALEIKEIDGKMTIYVGVEKPIEKVKKEPVFIQNTVNIGSVTTQLLLKNPDAFDKNTMIKVENLTFPEFDKRTMESLGNGTITLALNEWRALKDMQKLGDVINSSTENVKNAVGLSTMVDGASSSLISPKKQVSPGTEVKFKITFKNGNETNVHYHTIVLGK